MTKMNEIKENWKDTCGGQECKCWGARIESECFCRADWTPKEVYELREAIRLAHVRRKVSDRETTLAHKQVMKAHIIALLSITISIGIVIFN